MDSVLQVESLNLPEQKGIIGRLKVGDTTVLYTKIPLEYSDFFRHSGNKASGRSVILESARYFGIGELYAEGSNAIFFDPIYNGYGKKPGISDLLLPWFVKAQGYPTLSLNGSFDFFLPEGLNEGPIDSRTFFDLYPDKIVFYPVITERRIKAYYMSVGEVAKSL